MDLKKDFTFCTETLNSRDNSWYLLKLNSFINDRNFMADNFVG